MKFRKTEKQKKHQQKELSVLIILFTAAFLMLIGYLVFFLAFESERFINNPYNKRIDALSEKTIRGSIYANDGTVLAASVQTNETGEETRMYPFSNLYAHVVGFPVNGKMGVESAANFELLHSHSSVTERLKHAFTGEKNMGDGVVTTLDPTVQTAAYGALGSYRGAIVVTEVSTGRILAMVSKPDFDPNHISETFSLLSEDNESATLLNRATQGRYAPGSTFKLLTTLEYVHENPKTYEDYQYDCTGIFRSDGKEIHCFHNKAHGEEDLLDSFTNSCNTSYASLGLTLKPKGLTDLCNRALFNRKVPFDLPTEKSYFTLAPDASDAEIMETVIGQGKTLATPLQMALITAAVDHGGKAPRPYVLDRVVTDEGHCVKSLATEGTISIMSEQDAALLKEYMRSVVTDGTGRALNTDAYTVYGKTGTAEYNANRDAHSWFIGFAEKPGREDIAIAVIMEGAGSGSSFATPAAKEVFDAYFLQPDGF